ncbi:MAG: hypothetical protein Q9225_006940, partial [Loekoesia sp. 1 TL-2023]
MRKKAKEGRSLEQVISKVEAIAIVEGEGVKLEPLNPGAASSWKPLSQSQPVTWGPKNKSVKGHDPKQEESTSGSSIGD